MGNSNKGAELDLRRREKNMGLQITQVRVKNFRSIESLNVKLTQNNVVLGQNNCGKSNLLRAINIALTPNPTVSEEDIFVAHGE